jgi:hypothetical protein
LRDPIAAGREDRSQGSAAGTRVEARRLDSGHGNLPGKRVAAKPIEASLLLLLLLLYCMALPAADSCCSCCSWPSSCCEERRSIVVVRGCRGSRSYSAAEQRLERELVIARRQAPGGGGQR